LIGEARAACGLRTQAIARKVHTARMDWRDRAVRQAGAISRAQLAGCGLSESRITGMVHRRELVEILPAVYSARAAPASARQHLWAAALWSGGVISHRSAAELWQLPVPASSAAHVTVADRRFRHPVPGVRTHRVPLGRLCSVRFDGLMITDRARTVIDLLRTESLATARGLLDRALQRDWVQEHDVIAAFRDERGRTGNGQLRLLVAELEPGAQAESERRLHRLLRRAGITGWVAQYEVLLAGGTCYLDVALPRQRVAIEVDGRRHHGDTSDRFDDDRARGNELVSLGWRLLRVTWAELVHHPDRIVAQLRTLLAA
jgi:very-short-patch-repair endonuclease